MLLREFPGGGSLSWFLVFLHSCVPAYVHQLLLRVVLFAAALPVAVGLINSLQLRLAVVSIRLVLQVQRAIVFVLP